MLIPDKFTQLSTQPDLTQTLKSSSSTTAFQINCMRVATVIEFYPEDFTVQVKLVDKRVKGLNSDGSQILEEYPPIYAKVCFCSPFNTFPITAGMECMLIISDRELETWFISGGSHIQAYPRMHDLTDSVAIFGIRSLPQMINMLADCANFFYESSNIALSADHININAPTVQVSNFQAMNGASGNIVDSQGKTLAKVEHGIITEIY